MPAEGLTVASSRWPACAIVALAVLSFAACDNTTVPAAPTVSEQPREFSGRMTLAGSRQSLPLMDQAQANIFRLSGSVLLSGSDRPNLGFKAEIIGFSATDTGMTARSVWTDERGDRAFSELSAREAGPDKPVEGIFTGGTGRYAGLAGSYRFTWQYMSDSEDGSVGARVTDLRGSARLAPSARNRKESR